MITTRSLRSACLLIAALCCLSLTSPLRAEEAAVDETLQVCPSELRLTEDAVKATKTQEFNGTQLYCFTLEMLLQNHVSLHERSEREKFIERFAHRFDGMTPTAEQVDAAIPEVLRSLQQRFDRYEEPGDAARTEQDREGENVSIGAAIAQLRELDPEERANERSAVEVDIPAKSKLIVFEVNPDGPSAGLLQSGDEIISMNGRPSTEITRTELRGIIRGAADEDVVMTVRRLVDATPTELTVTVTRRVIERRSVVSKDLGDGITYIQIRDFMNKKAPAQFEEALRKAAEGKGVIFSVRSNPGGELENVISMMSNVIASGPLLTVKRRVGDGFIEETTIVGPGYKHIVTRTPDGKRELVEADRAPLVLPEDMPVVLLIDGMSASGSEMFSGTLQFLKRATVIGHPSRSKGEGQAVIHLPFGRLLLSTSLEFLPAGRAMNWVGIIPDIELEQADSPEDRDIGLEVATAEIQKQIAAAEARAARAKELWDLHHKQFEQKED